MLRRLVGQETEYAIRVTPLPGQARPSNEPVYGAVKSAIAKLVRTRPGTKLGGQDSIFVENGGAFCYECVGLDSQGGLVEGGTPECRGPSEALLFQKAQERLLIQALEIARSELRRGSEPSPPTTCSHPLCRNGFIDGEIGNGPSEVLCPDCRGANSVLNRSRPPNSGGNEEGI